MPEQPVINTPNSFYQAPLEKGGYVPGGASVIPAQPIDIYGLMAVQPNAKKITRPKTPYELMMEGTDPYATTIADQAPLQTNMATIQPLDDSAGLFHSQDGYGKYGYSTILGGGDNEDRYASNFRRDNPDLFWQSGFHPWAGIRKGFYWGGGFLEKTLESAVVKTGQGLAGIFGATIGNLANLSTGQKYDSLDQWLAGSTDNILSKAFDGWDDNLKERYHYFQEKVDRENKGFVQSMGDGDFWMNDISDGLGFLFSSMLEAGLISKLGLGTKVASRLAPLAQDVSTASLAPGEVANRASILSRAGNFLGVEGTGSLFVKNAVDVTTQTLALTAIESASEAKEVNDKVYATFEGKINPETGMYYTEEEKKRLAASAAGQVFKQNMTILIGPKFLETLVFNRVGSFAKGLMNKAFGQASTEAGAASGAVRSRLGTLASGTTYNKTSALQNIWKYGSAAAIGFASEGLFEENVQLAISRNAEQIFGGEDEFYRPGTDAKSIEKAKQDDDLDTSVRKRYWDQTKQFFRGATGTETPDDELSKSIGIGGMFGVGGGAVHTAIGIKQQAKIDNYWNNRINGVTSSLFETQNFFQTRTEERPDPQNPGKTKPTEVIVTDPTTGQPSLDENKLKGFLNRINNIQGIMDIVHNTEDPSDENSKVYQNKELNKLARNVLFTQLAMEYVKAGKKELLLSLLTSNSNFSDKDIQSLGYEPGNMTPEEKKSMLTKMTNIVNRLDKANDWIDNNVIDNVSEKREGKFGLAYTKTQKEKRRQEFEAKKAYLRGLAMQNTLLDVYLDELGESEEKLGTSTQDILSSTLDNSNIPVTDASVSLDVLHSRWNARIPALQNQIDVLKYQYAYHLDNLQAALTGEFHTRPQDHSNAEYHQMMVDDTLEKMNNLQEELDRTTSERDSFVTQDAPFEFREIDGVTYVLPKSQKKQSIALDELDAEQARRINAIKREEIGIQKGWIEDEWKNTAALKEEKTKAGKKDTLLSRRMTLSRNAYNTFFQREVMERDNSLGQRKLRLYHKEETQRINSKKYINNENKLLKSVRIQGKTLAILAEINGKKFVSELNALLERDLPSNEFAEELKKIIDAYNGRPMIISEEDKKLVDDQIDDTNDEYNFVNSIHEFMPSDPRFNDKYYDTDANGNFTIKPEYDDLFAVADVAVSLYDRKEDLEKIKKFLQSIPESIPGDWNNVNLVKKRIADVYTETADRIIDTYDQLTNNGQSEISGDSLSTQQDLDLIDQEINELSQLKEIFNERKDVLATPEFDNFIQDVDNRIEKLNKIKDAVKERLNSRLRENQDFLVDAVNNLVEQLGYNFDGTTKNDDIQKVVETVAGTEATSILANALSDLKALLDKDDKSAEDKKAINEAYWSINGQVSAIQEIIKNKDKDQVDKEIAKQKNKEITNLEATALMKKISGTTYYKDIIDNIDDSLLGALQLLFYQTEFSHVGLASTGQGEKFLDDQPGSPVYKFREDYNLRKFIRSVEKDDSRTIDNTEVSKEDLLEFLAVAQRIQALEDLQSNLDTQLNLVDQVEREKQVVQEKIDKKDNKYDNLIVPSIQQLFFIRKIASFLRTNKVERGGLTKAEQDALIEDLRKEEEKLTKELLEKDKQGDPDAFKQMVKLHDDTTKKIQAIRNQTSGDNKIGFRNWIYIQAPGGAGKTQSLGTWFNIISGIPRDRVLATAFTEEASRAIKKALLVGENGPKDAVEMASYIRELTKKKQLDQDVLIIDEFPAIDVQTQKELYDAIVEYTEAKLKAGKGEFKVVTMGDTNQLTFAENGSIIPRPSIIVNPNYFNENKRGKNDNHPAKMTIIPSLTVNFRTNLFAITSFVETFRGSTEDNVNKANKVTSTDPTLTSQDVKGVVALEKGQFQTSLISYLKLNQNSPRTKTLIVNESKLDEYKKLLEDNGIKVITDPNDEVTKGVYLTTVRNVQGFSFDEVFIDLENNDKALFSGTSNPEYIYNKAMYVATSRARNLIVTTNFPNIENIQDDSISQLENKSLTELQTKDDDFIAQRDLEINGAKSILGEQYSRSVVNQAPEKAENVVETPLDPEDEEEEQTDEEVEVEEEEQEKAPTVQEETPNSEENVTEEGVDESKGNEVPESDGIEDNSEESDLTQDSEGGSTYRKTFTKMWNSIKDKSKDTFLSMRDDIVELLFPTGQTTKFKLTDGKFTVTPGTEYENKALSEGDEIIVIPFQKSQNAKSSMNFGYAVVTPAIDQDGKVIPNSYRTVAILSDNEINKYKEKPETSGVFNAINQNEGRAKGFVSITYEDVSDQNGFLTSPTKVINELHVGKVVYSQSIKYQYGNTFRDMNRATMDGVIDMFINNFYANHLNNFPPEQRQIEYDKIRSFYNNSENAQIIIPTNQDLIGTEKRKPKLRVPPEMVDYVKPGRPYLVFRPYHARSSMQFIGLSRKFLNTNLHNETLEPIRDFINSAKAVKRLLEAKGITNRMGYSRSLSGMLSRLSISFAKDQNQSEYVVTMNVQGQARQFKFSNTEAERVYNMYSLYSEPNTQMIKAETEKEIRNLTNIKRARTYIFEDGESIIGTIESYNPNDRTFEVKDKNTGEIKTKSGVIFHTSKSYIGKAQQALDDIINSNGSISSRFTSTSNRTGFVTDKREGGSRQKNRFKFMNLLGSKVAAVPKSYNPDGSVREYYEDVIDILENLFNFAQRGELPGKQLNYIDEEGNQQAIEMKFRVPVALNARNQAGDLEHDYSNSPQNTSRDTTVPNSRYFDTAFESMVPTRVFIDFNEGSQEAQETEEEPTIPLGEEQPEEQGELIREQSATPLAELTKEEIQSLPFDQIRARLTPQQVQRLDAYAIGEGFNGIDHFFETIYSNHPEEQEIFRDYIIECLL
jgi:Mor family transcriptional regulator